MRIRALVGLFQLQGQVMLSRWREAARQKLGVPALLAGASASLLAGLMLLAASAAFAIVGTVLLGALAEAGEHQLGAAAGGTMANIAVILTGLTVLLSDTQRTGLDQHPLSILPLRRSEIVAHDLCSILWLQPSAFVIWPACLALVAGAGQSSPRAAMLSVPAASGTVALAAAFALLLRRLSTPLHPGDETPFLGRPLGRSLALGLLVGWLIMMLGPFEQLGQDPLSPLTPGHWVARALRASWAHDWRAAMAGLALHLVAFGTLALAITLPELRLPRATLPRLRRDWLPTGLVLTWSLPRARALFAQGLGTGVLVLILGAVLVRRGIDTLPIAPVTSLLSAWLIASAPAALMANALGLGGRAAASLGLTPLRPRHLLLHAELAIMAPHLMALLVLPFALSALFHDLPSAGAASLAGLGCLAAGAGVGSALSAWWPWPAALEAEGDPVWAPGAARLLMPLGQGFVLAPVLVSIEVAKPGLSFSAASATLVLGLALGVGGWLLGASRIAGQPTALTEALLD